jgi:hypothetical protein
MWQHGEAHAGMRVGDVRAFLAKECCSEIDYAPLSLAGHSIERGPVTFEKEQLVDLGHESSPARDARVIDPQRNVDS